jgi:Protein of unknown function (DUF2490)
MNLSRSHLARRSRKEIGQTAIGSPRRPPRVAGWPLASLLLTLGACMAPTATARAETAEEFWPEASVYVQLSPGTRLFLDLAYATQPGSGAGTLDLAAYLDISLRPIARPALQQLDWQRSRFFWARVGYDRILKTGGGESEVAENRGILSLWAKGELPEEVWVEGRARADLRWIGGDYSTRYRFRLEATREFTVREHAVVPYANVEWFYDTRYDGMSRTLAQIGSEFTVDRHFRFELLVARQHDTLPQKASVNAFGVVAKWYH